MHDVPLDIRKMGLEPFEDEGGVTGTCVLSTSHCAIHCWPLRQFFSFDFYSCRDFETEPIIHVIERHFDARDLQITDLTFCLEYSLGTNGYREDFIP